MKPSRKFKVFIPPLEVREILEITAARHGLTVSELCRHENLPRYVDARRDVALRLNSRGWGISAIGRFLGFHHSTIFGLLSRAGRRVPQPIAARPRHLEPAEFRPDLSGEWAI